MSLPALQRKAAESLIKSFCEDRVPLEARSQVRLEYKVRGSSFTLIERRIPWREPEGEWSSFPMAKFTFDSKRHIWKLLWRDRNGLFHHFDPPIEAGRIADLLAVVAEDPMRIFWG